MKTIPALAAACLTFGLVSRGADWPSWGGNDPGRNFYSPAKGIPDTFNPGQAKAGTEDIDVATTKGVRWVAKLGSTTYGTPVIAGGKVYIGTNNESPRDKRHVGDRSCLYCFDEKSGDFLWQLVVPKLKSGKVNDWEFLGLLSTPTVVGNRIYLVTTRCEVLCLDTEGMTNGNDGPYLDEAKYVSLDTGKPPVEPGKTDADIIWRYDMIDELGAFPHNGSNCSIIVVGDVLYVCTSNGQDWTHVNVPSPNSPSFIALDAKTGKLLGEDNAGIGPRIFHGQWTSPSTGVVNGKRLVFFGGGDGVCYALDAEPKKGDGSPIVPVLPGAEFKREEETDSSYLKKVWWADLNPPEYKEKNGKPIKYPAADGVSEINATPVFYKNRVYIATGQDPEHGEGVGHLVCLDATKTGDITKTGVIWSFQGIKRSISTVSIDPATGLLFIGDFSGFVYCLDAETGKLYWVHDAKAHIWGSTMVVDGKVFFGDEGGDLTILAADKTKKVLNKVELGAAIDSTPVVANGVLYVATQTHLFAVGAQAQPTGNDKPRNEIQIKN